MSHEVPPDELQGLLCVSGDLRSLGKPIKGHLVCPQAWLGAVVLGPGVLGCSVVSPSTLLTEGLVPVSWRQGHRRCFLEYIYKVVASAPLLSFAMSP